METKRWYPLWLATALIVISLLAIANEIRFQGCVARQDRQAALAVERTAPRLGIVDCARVPLTAE